MPRAPRPPRRRRLPARRVLVPAAVLAVVGVLVLTARSAVPSLQVYAPVAVDQASTDLPYAVDEQVCVRAPAGGEVREVRGTGTQGALTTQVSLPPDGAPVIAFPVPDAEAAAVAGAELQDELCLRLLLSATEPGSYAAPALEVVVAYGPGRLLTRGLDVTPPTTLEVVRTGPDPRLEGLRGS